MTKLRTRARLVGVAFAAAALTLVATAAYAAVGAPAGSGTRAGQTTEPTPEQTDPITVEPTATELPGESCAPVPVEPTLEPTLAPEPMTALAGAGLAAVGWSAVSRYAIVGPVSCEDATSIVTVSWANKKLNIVIKATKFGTLDCTLGKVKVVAPNDNKLNADKSVDVPYDKAKVTVTVEYEIECKAGDFTVIVQKTLTVEFTPPDGPLVIKNKDR